MERGEAISNHGSLPSYPVGMWRICLAEVAEIGVEATR